MPAPGNPPFPGLHPPQTERCTIDEAPGDKGVSLRHRVTWGGAGLQKSIPRTLPSPNRSPSFSKLPFGFSCSPGTGEKHQQLPNRSPRWREENSAGDKCLTSAKTETSSYFEGHRSPHAPSPLRSASTHTGSL